eukprot:CAMPEP_0202846124 /NCGR_PEP_ID=MMETSP1389-20130828/71840_1 /ASSEMBLY_ACC=CAM_ASM_000865 /TAXON_ID=302021 /ORGANISM="Rhodomonas sp., Strain CCMP768" /LENGTH=45 /DNA_ID= /DNA_START= /DNA_END= /DNA_ORIENTATION=
MPTCFSWKEKSPAIAACRRAVANSIALCCCRAALRETRRGLLDLP